LNINNLVRRCWERQQRRPIWLFIGEGSSVEENELGKPFFRLFGRLLDTRRVAVDLRRASDIYVANAVKCRRPDNFSPALGETATG
jgi:DNA polymerase